MRTYNQAIKDSFDIIVNTSEMDEVQCMKVILTFSKTTDKQ